MVVAKAVAGTRRGCVGVAAARRAGGAEEVGWAGRDAAGAAPDKANGGWPPPASCGCRAVFSVGACGLSSVAALWNGDAAWTSAVAGVGAGRVRGDQPLMPHLATLARYLPRLFQVNVSPDGSVQGNASASRVGHMAPLLPCALHHYAPQDVATCARRHLAATGSPLRLAFVGDSLVRNTLQEMVRSTRGALHYRVEGGDEDEALRFLDMPAKYDTPVQADGLDLSFHWSAFLHKPRNFTDVTHQGARDLLEAWAAGRAGPRAGDGPPPNVVCASSGMWDTSLEDDDEAVEGFVNTLNVMGPVLQALARRVRVLWHVHGPIKPWLATRGVPNAALDMMNVASWKRLGGGDVWLWDSRTVLALRQYTECRALHRAGLDALVPREWGCRDFQHPGKDVERAAVNMIWNLACNARLALHHSHCCAADTPPPAAT
ncbi:uncharacterized protein LOC123516093 [Portunus trituberculatus]|nr:uncharacterized protein LOC123516093 [Portunus trituberculatus]